MKRIDKKYENRIRSVSVMHKKLSLLKKNEIAFIFMVLSLFV